MAWCEGYNCLSLNDFNLDDEKKLCDKCYFDKKIKELESVVSEMQGSIKRIKSEMVQENEKT